MKENDKRLNIIEMVLDVVDSRAINTMWKLLVKRTVFWLLCYCFSKLIYVNILENK